jgi:hypothetical protein
MGGGLSLPTLQQYVRSRAKLFQWGVNLEVWIRDCINRLIDHDTPQKPYLTVFKFFQVFKGQMLPSGKSSWGYVLCELRRQTSDQLDH